MKKIKSYEQFFLNEDESNLMKILTGVLSGDKNDGSGGGFEDLVLQLMASNPFTRELASTGKDPNSGTYNPFGVYNPAPGNDDFALYMQHQQGVAGASGILKASLGTGKMSSDTLATKGGVKYANLVNNVPSDKPQVKKDIIGALDKGDQATAAVLFLNLWKEKWNSKSAEAKTKIEKPENKGVKDAIKSACDKYGVSFDFASTVANIESGFNPKAGNNVYKGLFAMKPYDTYEGAIPNPAGDKWTDPVISANNGVRLLKDGISKLKKQLGTDWASLKVGSWASNIA